MHQQQINRINEILQELNLLLPVVGESHHVFADVTINQHSSVEKLEFAIVEIEDEDD